MHSIYAVTLESLYGHSPKIHFGQFKQRDCMSDHLGRWEIYTTKILLELLSTVFQIVVFSLYLLLKVLKFSLYLLLKVLKFYFYIRS